MRCEHSWKEGSKGGVRCEHSWKEGSKGGVRCRTFVEEEGSREREGAMHFREASECARVVVGGLEAMKKTDA